MLAPKTAKTFGCVRCFVSFLNWFKFMPLGGQYIYILNLLWLLCISTMTDFRDRHI